MKPISTITILILTILLAVTVQAQAPTPTEKDDPIIKKANINDFENFSQTQENQSVDQKIDRHIESVKKEQKIRIEPRSPKKRQDHKRKSFRLR